MKNKGFTLIELIASLIVLSVIALIVVVNISKSLNSAAETLYKVQMDTYVTSVDQWISYETEISVENVVSLILPQYCLSNITSQIVSFVVEEDQITKNIKNVTLIDEIYVGYNYIFIPVLEKDGLVEENIISRNTKEEYSDLTFVALKQITVDETLDSNASIKSESILIDTNEKMLNYFAAVFFEINPDSIKTYLTMEDIVEYMPDELLRMSGETVLGIINIENLSTINTVTISVNGDGTYLIS